MRAMSRIFLITILFLCLVGGVHAYAQNEPATQEQESVEVSKDGLATLIDTLETPEEREKFIENLKTLVDANEESAAEQKESFEPISKSLGLEEQTEVLADEFDSFLEEHGLNASYVGRFLSTLGTFFIFWVFCLVTLKLSRAIRDYVLPKAEKYYINADRIRFYNRMVRYFFYFLLALVFIYFNAVIWGLSAFGFLENAYLVRIIGNLFSILLITLVALTAWEALSGAIEFAMQRMTGRYSKRLHTLLPIVRNVLFFVFSVMFALVLLSELGIDIMPLLAGAGVVGIAVGFGAQTMVKDFLTGFIIIMEDLIQIGDVATVGGKTGLIEKITIRKVQLRDLDGAVYTVPFSEISVVSNLTKDFSYYLMDVGIAYREDPDEVIGYLKEIDEELREDENFKNLILEPIHILGVDQFGDSAIIIKARIKTLPIKQWDVGREFNRRMKYKFDKHGIEIPFPHQTIYFGEDKNGAAPPAHIALEQNAEDSTDKKTKTETNAKKRASKAKPKKTGIESTDDAED